MFGLFFSFTFYHGSLLPVFPDLATWHQPYQQKWYGYYFCCYFSVLAIIPTAVWSAFWQTRAAQIPAVDYYRHVSDVCAVLYFIFGPLLQYNILVGSIVGGIYLGFCFNAGAPAVEAFIEKVSRRSNFEFGRARMFGCVGWALCASIVGIMFTINNQFVFWLGSGCALILAVLLFFAKTDAPSSTTVANAVGANHSAFSLKLALELFRQPKLWFCHCMLLAFPAPTMFLTNSLLISLLRFCYRWTGYAGIWLRNDNGRIT